MVIESPDIWYMDDSNLVINVCQDAKAEADDQGPVLEKCYTCDEAKYEVTFEGLWSRNTHPKVSANDCRTLTGKRRILRARKLRHSARINLESIADYLKLERN